MLETVVFRIDENDLGSKTDNMMIDAMPQTIAVCLEMILTTGHATAAAIAGTEALCQEIIHPQEGQRETLNEIVHR
jgi:hypothetical protein